MFFVYIITNPKGIFYKGSTSDLKKRLEQHRQGLNKFTSGKGPWELIFKAQFETRNAAESYERRIKRCNKKYLKWLITQPINMLDKNLDR